MERSKWRSTQSNQQGNLTVPLSTQVYKRVRANLLLQEAFYVYISFFFIVFPNKDKNTFVFREEPPLLITSVQRLQKTGVVTWGFASVTTCCAFVRSTRFSSRITAFVEYLYNRGWNLARWSVQKKLLLTHYSLYQIPSVVRVWIFSGTTHFHT